MDEHSGSSIVVQFYRWDRENDLDPSVEKSNYRLFEHHYGDDIDDLLDQLVGGPARLDRAAQWPTAALQDTEVTVVLHEDGPTFQFVFEQLPQFVSAATGVFSAWVAWRSKKRREPTEPEPTRTARIEIGEHMYTGPASDIEDLQAVVRALASMTSKSEQSGSR